MTGRTLIPEGGLESEILPPEPAFLHEMALELDPGLALETAELFIFESQPYRAMKNIN